MVRPSSRSSQQQRQQHFFFLSSSSIVIIIDVSHQCRCFECIHLYWGSSATAAHRKGLMTKLFEERQLLAELQITLLLRTKKDNRIHAAASLAHHEKSFVQKGGNDRAKCTHIPNICRRYAFDSLVLFWRSGMLVNVFSDLGFHHCCLDSEMQK